MRLFQLVATGTNTSDRVYYVTNFEFLNTVVDEIGTSIASVALEGKVRIQVCKRRAVDAD